MRSRRRGVCWPVMRPKVPGGSERGTCSPTISSRLIRRLAVFELLSQRAPLLRRQRMKAPEYLAHALLFLRWQLLKRAEALACLCALLGRHRRETRETLT